MKDELEYLYGRRKEVYVIRTGVDLNIFKPRNKILAKKKLGLEKNKIYGLYIGRGGYWMKGLDKTISLSKEIFNKNQNFRLLVIGADIEKVRRFLDNRFVIFLPPQTQNKIYYYYNASDIFFCLSRYEGGGPTLVTSEAMASGCLIVTDEEAKQEVLNSSNSIIVKDNYSKEAEKIIKILNNKKEKNQIISNVLRDVKKLSLENWASNSLKIILK
ncbi:MAG: glycosyltransferase family 4 protein [Candidatus Pacearchaeota archaeon]